MDTFYAVYFSVIIVGKQTCVIPRDLRHTPSMAAYKMIRLKFELACKSSIVLVACILKENSFTFKTDTTKEILKSCMLDTVKSSISLH